MILTDRSIDRSRERIEDQNMLCSSDQIISK